MLPCSLNSSIVAQSGGAAQFLLFLSGLVEIPDPAHYSTSVFITPEDKYYPSDCTTDMKKENSFSIL